jgi:Holliday junction resolvasome RuvABC endonuclease subunit
MTILALDLGSNLGWAARMPDGGIVSGTEVFRPSRFEGGGMQWVRFRKWLGEIAHSTGCNRIVFEEVRRHAGTTAAHVYGGFVAHLAEYCEGTLIPYSSIPVGTIKRFATGKGNANKEAMVGAMIARGFFPSDDNEADALAILLCAEAERLVA